MNVARLAHFVLLAWGWKRAALACLAGAASVLAFAPFNLWPVLLLTLPVVVWLIDGAGTGRYGALATAAVTGWWFGFGFFAAGLYWLGYAFLVDAQTFAWLMPLGVAGLPAALALFMAFGFALARLIWPRDATRVLALAAALTASEWLRGHILSGFPWNALGYALAEPLAFAQSAAYVGLWGMTFLAVALFASPATLADERSVTARPWLAPGLAAALLALLAILGALRLTQSPTSFVEGVSLRLMQPNLAQDEKFNYSAKAAVMRKYLALSDRPSANRPNGLRGVTLLIWPESAFPFFLAREADAMAQIADLLPPGTMLITGAVRPPDGPPRQPTTRAYNAIYFIDHDGSIAAVYDKLHLVPFGEYLPFQDALEKIGLQQFTKVHGGFIPGTRRRTLSLPRVPAVLPLICYEVIFPGEITARDERPQWIVNLTNDGWFGPGTGPYQHLQQTRVRAIEEGLPIVRAANTGISAVIDPSGRVVAALGLGSEGVLDAALPKPLPPTLYARTGDVPTFIFVAAVVILAVRRRRRQDTQP